LNWIATMEEHGSKRSILVLIQVVLIVISSACFLMQGVWSGFVWVSVFVGALFVALRLVDHFFFEDR
jgi:hypothetical protein